ncbi:hypothetical protein Pcinc_031853 [Petrolisthes cinctipes]|uniref:Uncharacterized protein n=1 Tax=Petrolisthes cinctipes TaxID=88211 RepID=A0AAE1EVS8_PETCI|nr:hypothetical protein Pcinc_031853 [Petrolisthes cinctipes]
MEGRGMGCGEGVDGIWFWFEKVVVELYGLDCGSEKNDSPVLEESVVDEVKIGIPSSGLELLKEQGSGGENSEQWEGYQQMGVIEDVTLSHLEDSTGIQVEMRQRQHFSLLHILQN